MATPLGELLRQLRTDTDVQIRFHQSPAEYLHEHGWGDLDAEDMQEALLLLADAAPAAEASGWIAAGESIHTDGTDAATALDTAIGTLHDTTTDLDDDTDTIDGIDEQAAIDDSDPGDIDGIASGASAPDHPEPAEPATAEFGGTGDDGTGDDGVGDPAAAAGETATDVDAAEPLVDLDPFDHLGGPDDGFDPTDTPTHPDTSLTEDSADIADHGIDPEPDWDDPS